MIRIKAIVTILALYSFFIISCKKYEEAGPLREPQVNDTLPVVALTNEILMYKVFNRDTSVRLWKVVHIIRKYYNSSGDVDSSIVPPLYGQQFVRFLINPNTNAKIYGVDPDAYGNDSPITLLIPALGNWLLSQDGKKLDLKPNALFPGGGPGGVFDVTTYDIGTTDVLALSDYGIDAIITRTLNDGRKLIEAFSLEGMK